MRRLLLLLLFTSLLLRSQVNSSKVTFVTSDPAGACSVPQNLQYNISNGKLWGCDGTWTQIGAGGGGGTPSAPFSSIQFNNAGAFGGNADFTYKSTAAHVLSGNQPTDSTVGAANRPSMFGSSNKFNGDFTALGYVTVLGIDNQVYIDSGATNTAGKQFTGAYNLADMLPSSTTNINNIYGSYNVGMFEGSGHVVGVISGVGCEADSNSTSLTPINWLRCFDTFNNVGGNAVINNAADFYAQQQFVDLPSTVVNFYGLFVEDQTGATNNWAIKTGLGKVQFGDVVQSASVAIASLPSSPVNGMQIYCSDCKVTSGVDNTCTGTGSGAMAFRINGAWKCVQ